MIEEASSQNLLSQESQASTLVGPDDYTYLKGFLGIQNSNDFEKLRTSTADISPSGENGAVAKKEISDEDRCPGRYDFSVLYPVEEERITKACPFTFSPRLKHLFAMRGKSVPVKFSTTLPITEPKIKCYLQFTDSSDKVKRCPHHLREDTDVTRKHHVLHVLNSTCEYVATETRNFVVTRPKVDGEGFMSDVVRFACTSRCAGGIDRRSVRVVFKLIVRETVVGSDFFEVNICTTPGRDRQNLEKKLLNITPTNFAHSDDDFEDSHVLSKQEENEWEEDDENYIYSVSVDGVENARVVSMLHQMIENISDEQVKEMTETLLSR